jgi:general secretion pathway protein D
MKRRLITAGSGAPERNGFGRHGESVVNAHRVRLIAALTSATFAFGAAFTLPAEAGTLAGVRLDVANGRNARVILAFNNGVPQFKIFGNDTTDVALILQSTSRGLSAPTLVVGREPLKSVSIDNFGDNLNVTFHESGPANISVVPGPGQTLIVTVSASGGPNPLLQQAAPPPQPVATPTPTGIENTEVVRLKYADVSEVVGLLVAGQQIPSNDSFTPQEQQFGSSGLTGGAPGSFAGGAIGGLNAQPAQALAQLQQNFGQPGAALGQQINENIGVDRRLNAIILTGSPDVIAKLKAKIDLIDVPLASVELETQIVELNDTAAKQIGIDFTNTGGPVAAATYQIKNLTTGQGTLNLQAAVYAQIAKGLGRTIARPRITALDGTSAQIITGTQIPIVTSIAVSGVSAVSSQVQYINVGVSFQIQPRISPDGFVTSHIFSQVSSETGTSQGYPTLSQREATTSATVKDGDSFVIGGLLQQNDLSNVQKVPGLGDIPLIGGLFHYRNDSTTNTNLYIIVTPHILKNGLNPPPAKPLPSPLPPLPSIKHQ